MDCAICFESIGPARVTLGCTHSFHINCIVTWYYRQNMQCEIEKHEYEAGQTASSCPCCRAVPASKLDDIPSEQLINFQVNEDDSESMTVSEDGAEEDGELAAATPRSAQPQTPRAAPVVPPLDLSALRLQIDLSDARWTRTGPTSWERTMELSSGATEFATELAAPPAEPAATAWDAAQTAAPPPDSLVEQIVGAARKIQAAWRAAHTALTPLPL